ncbi:hypothetical protein F3Y22_tig00111166pilonHSYRG00227 [Hibiscus syriacus]|uniref:Uncharacterized protein n=1 Tax=Hibiscus syriacus TaxID=106335 RepID=A0A6A2YY13_HIBSY|nr:hypothetical protein F3Y22_tig00111166pilonHSYRG00227 [Hibiscus syriacus]
MVLYLRTVGDGHPTRSRQKPHSAQLLRRGVSTCPPRSSSRSPSISKTDDTIILRSVEPATAINVDEGSDTPASASRSPTIKRSSSNRFRQFSQELKAEAVAKARQFSQELKAELRKLSCGHGHTSQTVNGFDSALAARALRKQRAQLDRTRSGLQKHFVD